MNRYAALVALSIVYSIPVSVSGKEDPFSYFDAALINAYAASSFDVAYKIEYTARPSRRKKPVQDAQEIVIQAKLRGRQIYDRENKRLLSVEPMVDLNQSIVQRITKPSSKDVVFVSPINEIRDGIWTLYRDVGPSPAMSYPGEFVTLQERCNVQALPLIGLHGWTARYNAAGIDYERSRFLQIGDPSLKHQVDGSIRIDLSRPMRRDDAQSGMFGVSYNFDPESFIVTSFSNYYDVPNESIRQSDHRQITKYAEFDGVYLPVETQITRSVVVDAFGEPRVYDEEQKITLIWRHVNEPRMLPVILAAGINSEEALKNFLDQ